MDERGRSVSTPLPVLYKLQDLVDAYGWSLDTLYDYIDVGDLPASKIGRTYYVTPEGVATLLERRARS